LEDFIKSLGFDPILSEKGNIAYPPDTPLDESCCREVSNSDIFVLIIGRRYGTEAGTGPKEPSRKFFDRYDSITKQEYRSAVLNNIPTYILIEKNVDSEYSTYLKNKENKEINYVYVDSINIFELIDDIRSQPYNNPVFTFDRYLDIEEWLCEQWAGFFKELLNQRTEQKQLVSLTEKVAELGEINVTLKKYLETIISKLSPDESEKLIKSENKRLHELWAERALRENEFVTYMGGIYSWDFEKVRAAIEKAHSMRDFIARLREVEGKADEAERMFENLRYWHDARMDLNQARRILGKATFEDPLVDPIDEK
jgi:hypothetical protein